MKNVVLLTIDTFRKDVIGCYGNPNGFTPFLDSIQRHCIRFTSAQSVGPYTQSSFPGILTSSYYLDYGRSPQVSQKATVISEVLKENGVTTAGFHSNPYLSAYFGWNRGWDHFYDSMQDTVDEVNPYVKGNAINEKVDLWLTSHLSASRDKALFLWVHYMDLHEPYAPEGKYVKEVDPSINIGTGEYMKLFKEVVLPRDTSNKETVQLLKRLYEAQVIEVDEYVKMFFDILRKHGILEESTVIITSDHGDEFDEHGGLSHDGKMYAELVHVPLMIYDLRFQQEQVCDGLVSGLDIPPTILHLFGLAPNHKFQGRSILPIEDFPSKGCFGECIGKLAHKVKPTDKPAYFYSDGKMKIIYREENEQWELYDLGKDPSEATNIVESSLFSGDMKNKLSTFINRNKEN